MKRAFVFPGQGSQFPGMGKELAEASPIARQLFEEIDDALSQHLSRLMFEGPEGPGEASVGELVCAVANDTSPGQIVVSGHAAAVAHAIALAAGRGSRRSIMLPVSAPFHSPLMQPAADMMQEALAEAALQRPAVPLVANVTARETTDPDEIRALLVAQVTHMVRWREAVQFVVGTEVE